MTTRTKRVNVRVLHRAAGWVLPDFTDLADCTSNFHRQQDSRPACAAPAVWKVVEQYPMHLTISFWCADDMPAEFLPLALNVDR